ncbi:MAG: hypothetical protein NZ555_02805 [Geminicoccaceae bacterium]|nr:hypothetical protein [Geminicoccaceae bacterium]MCX8100604.1 hypothetical protein [Geminicoccaceae bacterium]
MIRTREVGRLPSGAARGPANDNARAADRPAPAGARFLPNAPRARRLVPASGPARSADGAVAPFGWWMAGVDAFCRLPPVATTLACVRAWSELGMLGAAGCTTLAAAGTELAGLVVGSLVTAAATPALVRARPAGRGG